MWCCSRLLRFYLIFHQRVFMFYIRSKIANKILCCFILHLLKDCKKYILQCFSELLCPSLKSLFTRTAECKSFPWGELLLNIMERLHNYHVFFYWCTQWDRFNEVMEARASCNYFEKTLPYIGVPSKNYFWVNSKNSQKNKFSRISF